MSDDDARSGILESIRGWFWNSTLRILWLCAYATIAVAIVAFVFLANDQGQDLLRISAEPDRFWWNLCFAVAAVLLGLSLWYSARLLLAWDQVQRCVEDCLKPQRGACRERCEAGGVGPGEDQELVVPRARPADTRRFSLGRIWLPRVFGAAVPAIVGLAFLLLDTPEPDRARLLAVLHLVLAGLLWTFLVKRRAWFLHGSRRGLDQLISDADRLRMVLILTAALLAGAALTAAFMIHPVALPQMLGAPAILLLGLAGIALFGSLVLTYAFIANGQASGTTLAILVAVVVGLLIDNHWIRVDPEAPPPPQLAASARLAAWDSANPPLARVGERRPVIIVAAAGGGIRAAYWTASVLASLESTRGFSQSLFAISGVSGGSVGAAMYTAIKRRQLAGGLDRDTLAAAREALRQDFLSPVTAGLLFPDLAQRFVPYPVAAADRQRFLELAFEGALGEGPNPLSAPFTALYGDGLENRLPNLLLNATVVDSGRRAIFSSIPLDGFTDTLDLMACGFDTRKTLLSAAAGASARFTYVSPAGSLLGPGMGPSGGSTDDPLCTQTPDPARLQKIRLVDGGYFENSGAATAVDLLDQIDSPAIYPILILIGNDPQAPPVCVNRHPDVPVGPGPAGEPARDLLSEVASPVRALLNARTARGRLAEVDAAKRFERSRGAVIELSLWAVAQAELAALESETDASQLQSARERLRKRLVEPPLGWSLSGAARSAMDRTLGSGDGGIAGEVANLAAVLAGNADAYRWCGAR